MYERTAELLYNVTGQTVTAIPPEWAEGAPSAVTVSVYAGDIGDDDTAEFTAAATVDSVSTTVNVASGYSQTYPNRLYLASLVGIVTGVPYRLDNGQGQRQIVKLKRLDTSYAECDSDLLYDYPITTSTLKGVRMTFSPDAAWIADESHILLPEDPDYRIVWSYTLATTARRFHSYCRLVRKAWESLVTVDDLRELWPDVTYAEMSDTRGEQFRRALSGAGSDVRADFLAAGYRPEQVSDTELLRALHVKKAWHRLARVSIAPPGREVEPFIVECERDYEGLFNRVVRGKLRVPVSTGATGATDRAPASKFISER